MHQRVPSDHMDYTTMIWPYMSLVIAITVRFEYSCRNCPSPQELFHFAFTHTLVVTGVTQSLLSATNNNNEARLPFLFTTLRLCSGCIFNVV